MSARYIARGLAVGGALAAGLAIAAPAQADPLPEGCVKERSTITCTEQEPVGQSGKFKTTETTTKGSFESSHPEESTFTNPGGNQPPGQQP